MFVYFDRNRKFEVITKNRSVLHRHHLTPVPVSCLHYIAPCGAPEQLTGSSLCHLIRRQRKVRDVKPSNVKLVSSQVVHEGLNQEVSGEVEDQAEGDGDGQRRQSLLKDGQQQQSEAQALRR